MLERIINLMDKVLTFIENWTLFLSVMAGLISLFINVILRYGFNYSLAWSEELIREVIMFTTFIGCSAAIKNRNMIVIDALPQLIPRLKVYLAFFTHFSVIVFCGLIVVLGWKMAALQWATKQATITMEIPYGLLYGMLPMMGIMMFLRTLQNIYKDIKTFFPGTSH